MRGKEGEERRSRRRELERTQGMYSVRKANAGRARWAGQTTQFRSFAFLPQGFPGESGGNAVPVAPL